MKPRAKAAVIALFTALSCSQPYSPSSSPITPSSLAVEFAASRSEHGIVVRAETTPHQADYEDLSGQLEFLCKRDPRCSGPVRVQPSTIENFYAAQSDSGRVSVAEQKGIRIVSAVDFERLAEQRLGRTVDLDSPDLVQISPVGESSDGQQALLFLMESCGSLCGGGWYLVFEKSGASWSLAHALLAWIS